MQGNRQSGNVKKTQFVCNRELKVGDCTLFSRIVWRVTGKQSIPRRHPLLLALLRGGSSVKESDIQRQIMDYLAAKGILAFIG